MLAFDNRNGLIDDNIQNFNFVNFERLANVFIPFVWKFLWREFHDTYAHAREKKRDGQTERVDEAPRDSH